MRPCLPVFRHLLFPAAALCCAFLLALALLLQGCMPRGEVGPAPPELSPRQVWDRFWSRQRGLDSHPASSIRGSLNIFTPERSHRLTFRLWGNHPLPFRLRLRAGLGTTLSMWEVRREGVLVYFPQKNRAYVRKDTRRALADTGLNLPLSLEEMRTVLASDWRQLLWRDYGEAKRLPGQGFAFFSSQEARIQRVVLDRKARLVSLSGSGPGKWRMRRKDFSTRLGRLLSRRLEVETGQEQELILRIKDFRLRQGPWPEADLRISLPGDTIKKSPFPR